MTKIPFAFCLLTAFAAGVTSENQFSGLTIFQPGDTIYASTMNSNFEYLEDRLDALPFNYPLGDLIHYTWDVDWYDSAGSLVGQTSLGFVPVDRYEIAFIHAGSAGYSGDFSWSADGIFIIDDIDFVLEAKMNIDKDQMAGSYNIAGFGSGTLVASPFITNL